MCFHVSHLSCNSAEAVPVHYIPNNHEDKEASLEIIKYLKKLLAKRYNFKIVGLKCHRIVFETLKKVNHCMVQRILGTVSVNSSMLKTFQLYLYRDSFHTWYRNRSLERKLFHSQAVAIETITSIRVSSLLYSVIENDTYWPIRMLKHFDEC